MAKRGLLPEDFDRTRTKIIRLDLSPDEAYMLVSVAVDFAITQLVDGTVGGARHDSETDRQEEVMARLLHLYDAPRYE